MGVGSIGGRGGGGRGGKVGAKRKGGGSSKIGRTASLEKTPNFATVEASHAAVGLSETLACSSERISSIARALRSGEIASKADATRLLVSDILKERMNLEVRAIQTRIVDEIMDDPRLARTLELIWQKA
jgi:hypothetical protein